MTIQKCQTHCSNYNYPYSGLQAGSYCFCGDRKPTSVRSSSECNLNCKGYSGKKCGGSWRNSVYDTYSRGCFVDNSVRVLPYAKWTSSSMTIEKCRDHCYRRKYKYAGLEVGRECFCGNTMPGMRVGSASCSTKCAGNSAQRCGATWKISVFNTAYSESSFF